MRAVMIVVVVIAGCGGGSAPTPVDAGPVVFLVGDGGMVTPCRHCRVVCDGTTPACVQADGVPPGTFDCTGCVPSCFHVADDGSRRATEGPVECFSVDPSMGTEPSACFSSSFHACMRSVI